MIIYRKPTGRRQHTVIAHTIGEITLGAGSTPSHFVDGIIVDVMGSPHQNGQASKYVFQVLLTPEDLALLDAARERFNAGGDFPYRRLGLSVLPGAENAETEREPEERLVLRYASYEMDKAVRL